jgi:RNA polymerase sigma factor (sigma-70 family)
MINYARHRGAKKRGRQFEVTLTEGGGAAAAESVAVSELDGLGDALEELTALDPRLGELVDLHFFGGLSFAEIAELRGISERTVQRDWRKARLLLHSTISDIDLAV